MILALTGQKGGSGKSTTAICLAAEWRRRGRRVLLVDADPQGTARTWGELAAAAGVPAPVVVAMGASMHRPDQLPALARAHDVTVIDCPPRHDAVQRAALMVADLALLPCGPTPVDAWALCESLSLVEQARQLRPFTPSCSAARSRVAEAPCRAPRHGPGGRGLDAAVLITRKVARSALGARARADLAEQCPLPLLEVELGLRVAFQEAAAMGQGVTTYAPRSRAAAEVRRLVDELELRLTTDAARERSDAAA